MGIEHCIIACHRQYSNPELYVDKHKEKQKNNEKCKENCKNFISSYTQNTIFDKNSSNIINFLVKCYNQCEK